MLAGGALLALLPKAAFAKDPVIYTYDALGRLTSATYPNGATITYTYDAAGNRTKVVAGPPAPLSAAASASTWFSDVVDEDPPITAVVTGGIAPYAYLWQRVSGHTGTSASSPTGASTTWMFTSGSPTPPIKVSVWRCRVTDAASTVVYTGDVEVTLDVL